MKGKVCVLLSALIVLCMLCSCGGGSGSESSSSMKTVAVGFDLNIVETAAKSISVTDQAYSDLQFWYSAIPQWTSHDQIAIQGDTRVDGQKTFVKLNNFTFDNPTGTVGYFAQGQWAFDIEVRKPLNAGGYAVLWKKYDDVRYINTAGTIIFTVAKNIDQNKTGTVKFNVTAPKTANTDSFKVYYKLLGTNDAETLIPSGLAKDGADDAAEATLTGSYDLPSGLYSIAVKYYSSYTNEQNFVLVGASTVATEVIPDGDITVRGAIENNKWQNTSFTIKGMYKLTVAVTATEISQKGTVSVDTTETVHFTCTPAIKELDGITPVANVPTYYYEWRINGAKVNNAAASEFDWVLTAGDAKQYAYIDCIVYFKDGETVIGSAYSTFRLEVTE